MEQDVYNLLEEMNDTLNNISNTLQEIAEK